MFCSLNTCLDEVNCTGVSEGFGSALESVFCALPLSGDWMVSGQQIAVGFLPDTPVQLVPLKETSLNS